MRNRIPLLAGLVLPLVGVAVAGIWSAGADEPRLARVDPAAWGSDHVGHPLPVYITGDECLFCHRDIGPNWGDNRHQLTIRPASPDDPAVAALRELSAGRQLAGETTFLLGSRRVSRFLKRSSEYGKLELLSACFVAPAIRAPDSDDALRPVGERQPGDPLTWSGQAFGARCAGCHSTAVNVKTRAFSALSLDCFACHGDVSLEHTKDPSRVLLSSVSREARQVTSICGQCHLRGGTSRSTGLPYPNTFVAGDNLFRDFRVDFSDETVRSLPAAEQHIWLNARDVAVFEQSATTCLTCHDVHGQSTEKHQQGADSAICATCHVPGTNNGRLREAVLPASRLRTHNQTCDY